MARMKAAAARKIRKNDALSRARTGPGVQCRRGVEIADAVGARRSVSAAVGAVAIMPRLLEAICAGSSALRYQSALLGLSLRRRQATPPKTSRDLPRVPAGMARTNR